MTNEFVQEYKSLIERADFFCLKAIKEGFLALDEYLDNGKILKRDIFEFGIQLVIDYNDRTFTEKILSNLIALETDYEKKLLKYIAKEAVLAIQAEMNCRQLKLLMTSYVDIDVEETMKELCE